MHGPPVLRLAAAYATGAGLVGFGAPWWTAPLLTLVGLAAPNGASHRPDRLLWPVALLAGAIAAGGERAAGRCAWPEPGTAAVLEGRFLAAPRSGAAPFVSPSACDAVTVVTSMTSLPAGVELAIEGRWMPGRLRPWLRATGLHSEPSPPRAGGSSRFELRWAPVRWRDRLVERIDRLYGERAPIVAALTLARREGMDRELRESFARTGIAHLLAISGFHVGVLAGAALALLRLAGVGRRRAGLGAAGAAWLYVALIGFPAAASRAALILGCVALGRAGGRPPARWGALATALLILLVLDPGALSGVGFQLSFAGAAGLVAWATPLTTLLGRGRGRWVPVSLRSAIAAGVAATVATFPVVAWHFGRVSVVGIPMTLAATPLVSVALPGSIVTLLLDPFAPGAAAFVAGGVDALLGALEALATSVAGWDGASRWVSRNTVSAGLAGWFVAARVARHPRVRGRARRGLLLTYTAAGVLAWPVAGRVAGLGSVDVVVVDVGQGDAIALRSPRGRWILVDAGPPAPGSGELPALRAIRERGVSELTALVLTHPDLDHIGGAAQILTALPVGVVYDPGAAVGKAEYLAVLERAAAHGVPWRAARAGQVIDFDGAVVEVLHPTPDAAQTGETNEASVVLRLRFGSFDALLTGDAYKPTERRLAPQLADIELLKVGHHGSDTSTDSLLLARARPRAAVVSAGRFNRYGHPTREVLERLGRAGVRVYRTDELGTITVRARRDGSFTVRTTR